MVGTSDSLIAIDMETGKTRWIYQHQAGTAWNEGCLKPDLGDYNCQERGFGENEFVGSTMLVNLENGRRVLVGSAHYGLVVIDPDLAGKRLWQQAKKKRGKPGRINKIAWGPATDGRLIFVGTETYENGKPCHQCRSGVVTVIPGVVFAGNLGGRLTAYSASDGEILWQTETAREFDTVNGIKARGGAMDGSGPVVVDGTVFVSSGYLLGRRQLPGNVLLAYSMD